MDAEKKIVRGIGTQFGQQQLNQKRRAEDLLEIGLELRTQSEADQTPQTDGRGRAREGFDVRGVDGALADFFQVGGMPQARHGMAIEQFKDLRLAAAHPEEKNTVRQAGREHGRAAFKLLGDVFAPIRNGFQPTIGFLSHSRKSSFWRSSVIVSTPAARNILMVAKVSVAGLTPPVAESNSEAVESNREAKRTASRKFICEGEGFPYRSWKLKMLRMVPEPEPEAA